MLNILNISTGVRVGSRLVQLLTPTPTSEFFNSIKVGIEVGVGRSQSRQSLCSPLCEPITCLGHELPRDLSSLCYCLHALELPCVLTCLIICGITCLGSKLPSDPTNLHYSALLQTLPL